MAFLDKQWALDIISALRSMYRFNGSDGRLRRTCETASWQLEGVGVLEKNKIYKN